MFKLALVTHVFVAPTVMGILIIALLTMGMVEGSAILWAAIVGFVLSIPVSWFVAGRINRLTRSGKA